MLYIGIDLGTSAVKLLLMDGEGAILKIVSRAYPISYPQPGWSEQEPAHWLKESLAGMKELTEDCDKAQVAGIAVAGQMHGLVALDEADRVLRPAILWNDGRTAVETAYLNETIGREELSRRTGNIAFAGFTAPKLLWMQKHEPELYEKIRRIMLPKDYLSYMFSGVHCTDYSDASGMLLLDVEHKRWSKEMLETCGVKEEWMPRLYESYETVGTLKPELAAELGLSPEVKIAAGAGDNAAAAVGTATVGDGKCNISLGTSGTIFICSDRFEVDGNNALHSFDHADGGYHLMGVMLSAASCNKWWMEDILKIDDYAGEQGNIDPGLLGNNRVFFLPYLMGERSPHNNSEARGVFAGLTMDTSREALTLAVMEGVAFGIRDSLEVARSQGIDVKRSKLCGGGAKSPLWRQVIANVLNLELETIESEEGPGYGAAILAAVACGEFSSVAEAATRLVKVADIIKPESELANRYEKRYHVFRSLYPAVKPAFQLMAENFSM